MFQVRGFESRTLSWWYSERKNIDMSPVYQRKGKLWNRDDKAYLIDSILNNFDIPKIYIADFTYVDSPLNRAKKPYAIIDGRQRFEAIFDFFEARVTLREGFEYAGDPSLSLAGLSYKDLQRRYPQVASRFDNFNLSVMTVITDEEPKINELFVRLNRNKPLTGAEVRNAMRGPIPALTRRLASAPFFNSNIRFQTKRGQDKNAAAKLLLIEFRGRFVDTKRVHLDRFVEEAIRSESSDFDGAAERVTKVLSYMRKVFIRRDPLLSSQGQLPVYYWLVRAYFEPHGKSIREFLVDFERRRAAIRQAPRAESSEDTQDLLRYTDLSRSVNDQASMSGRFQILEKAFKRFLKAV